MKEEVEENLDPSAAPDQPETDLFSLLRAMQQQLLHLEKKVDLLLGRQKSYEERPSHAKSFNRGSFSKSYRPHDHSHHERREREQGPRDKDSVRGHFYERRPQEKARRANPTKRSFGFKRKDRE
jgi:hypothetical protein